MITVVGGGFAGVEAAWAIAQRGGSVRLFEMRPKRMTPAHQTDFFAELVCSNSFKSKLPTSPAGQLKAEMVQLGSLVIPTAEANSVPGGEALCVDRALFGRAITDAITNHPNIEVIREEFEPTMIRDDEITILATGPLTSPTLSDWIASQTGREHLYFFDAVSPTVDASTLDRSVVFSQSRYDKGGDDYLNCPFNREQYEQFVAELVAAERAPIHVFEAGEGDGTLEERLLEQIKYFAGCMPIEAIAEKGARSLAFGNFKPVGLEDPRTGRRPYAALQLRPENREKTLYSLVACQTRLKWGEQKRVFQMVPGLENAEFVRYGVIHRNTYVEAPRVLLPTLQMRSRPNVYIAGQLTGVEGYLESAAMGIYAGIQAVNHANGCEQIPPPTRACAYGALIAHLQDDTPREFAPMNVNWGLFPAPNYDGRDKSIKRAMILENARIALANWMAQIEG